MIGAIMPPESRASRFETLMATAIIWGSRSTCDRLSVGCVISRGGRILVQGYNGAPAKMPHCPPNHAPEECLAVHAEQNAISWAAKEGVALDQSALYVTHSPCLNCARTIINSGISTVIYVEEYRITSGVDLLKQAGVEVIQMDIDDIDQWLKGMIG